MSGASAAVKQTETKEAKTAIREAALDAILKKHGSLSSEIVVKEARKFGHPLHNEFEWDDKKAGHKYRLEQALSIIMATRFVVYLRESDAPPTPVRGERVRKFVPAYASGGFKARRDVLENPPDRDLWVERRLAMLDSWCKSVVDVPELNNIRGAVQQALKEYRGGK